ncbi:MAG: hypothetical protein HFJ55_07680 [Clostridia bacterium]|nr:hypothetical protein [Clostridia bacterium]
MNFLTKKNILFKLIVCLCLIVSLFNFGIGTKVHAETAAGSGTSTGNTSTSSTSTDTGNTSSGSQESSDGSSSSEPWSYNKDKSEVTTGGKLISPVTDLLLGVGDAILSVIQKAIMGTSSAITIDTGRKIWFTIIAAALAVLVVGITVAFIGPIISGIAVLKIFAGAAGIAKIVVAGIVFATAYTGLNGAFLPDITLIPTYSISPEEIFKGEVLLFDVNIFNPKKVYVEVYKPAEQKAPTEDGKDLAHGAEASEIPKTAAMSWEADGRGTSVASTSDKGTLYIRNNNLGASGIRYKTYGGEYQTYNKEDKDITVLNNVEEFSFEGVIYRWSKDVGVGAYSFYKVEGDKTVSTGKRYIGKSNLAEAGEDKETSVTKLTASDVKQIPVEEWNESKNDSLRGYEVNYYYYHKDGNVGNNAEDNRVITSSNNSAIELKSTIAKWYYILRNVAIVALMIVLLYIGIRILTATIASDKAKYKEMMVNWLVAMCLIFIMQYFMVFINEFTGQVIELFASAANKNLHTVVINKPEGKLVEGLKGANLEQYVDEENDQVVLTTNLMGKVRLLAEEQNGTSLYIGYAICFVVLVLYTIIFTFVYAKRLLYVMFLTIIAPLVAISYPIDKIGDGKSQAFDMWLREYIFNLIIQPFHLLLYVVLISTAFDLAGSNVIYSLVAIGFMIPAEKFLRKMFGFDKASTPGFLGGAAGAAVAMTTLSKIGQFASKGMKGGKPNNNVRLSNNSPEQENRGANSGNTIDRLLGRVGVEGNLPEGDNTGGEGLNGGDLAGNGSGNLGGNMNDTHDAMFGANGYADSYNDTYDTMFGTNGTGVNGYTDPYNDVYGAMFGTDDADRDSLLDDNAIGDTGGLGDNNPVPNGANDVIPSDIDGDAGSDSSSSTVEPDKSYLGAIRDRMASSYTSKEHWKDSMKSGLQTAKTMAKLTGGAVGAGIGVSAGIAAGSPGDVVKNASVGGIAGSTIAGGTTEGISNHISSAIEEAKKTREENLKEQYGENYSKYQKQEADKKFMKDAKAARMYASELNLKSKEDIKSAMEDAVKYREYGVTDDKLIIKAMKSGKGNAKNRTSADRIAAARLSKNISSQKDFDTIKEKVYSKMSESKGKQVMDKIKEIRKDDNFI